MRTIVTTREQYNRVRAEVLSTSIVCVDTETTGLDHTSDLICGVCIYLPLLGKAYYLPFRHGEGDNLPEELLKDIGDILHSRPHVIGYNYQYDVKMWKADGVEMPDRYHDPILAAQLVNENEPSFKMEELIRRYIDPEGGGDETALIDAIVKKFGGSRKGAKGKLWAMHPDTVGPYGMADVEQTWDLYLFYQYWIRRKKLRGIYDGLCAASKALAKMEIRGVQVDVDKLLENQKACVGAEEQALEELYKVAGYKCNPRSPKQMKAVLGTENTKAETIETLDTPEAKALLHYRKVNKARTTYYAAFAEQIDETDSLHPNFRIVGSWEDPSNKGGTVAGRFSCQHPNLQAVTRGSGNPWNVRDVITARDGYVFVERDYSQAELRVASHYAGCHKMAQMFKDGIDVHSGVSQEMGVPRPIAKMINFSFLYGIGAKTFSRKYHMPYQEAAAYLNGFDRRFPEFRIFMRKMEAFADRHRMIRMWTGRCRHFNAGWKTKTKDAMNNLIQGAVAEMIRVSIVRIDTELPWAPLVLTVHDSVINEVPVNRVEEFIEKTKAIMEPQPWCTVPIRVDTKVGDTWGGLKEWPH